MVALLVFTMGGVVIHAATYSEELRFSFDAVPGILLQVDGVNGSITAERWDGTTIEITANKRVKASTEAGARRTAEDIRVISEKTVQAIHVRVEKPVFQLFTNVTVSHHIRIPNDWYGKVVLKTSNGRINVARIDGQVELRTSNGAIKVDGHAGILDAHTSNGAIELIDVDSNIRARTSNGSIVIRNGTLRGTGELRTSNGRINLTGELFSGANYEVRTSNGSIDFTVDRPSVNIDFKVSRGSVNLRNVSLTNSNVGSKYAVGRIGLGEAKLWAQTSNGSITLTAK